MSRSHETVIDLKATPEEVFRGITDPEQIVKWFCDEARVDPRVGGEYYFAWGGMGATTTITAWEPGQHFGTASERSKTYGHKGPVDTGVVHACTALDKPVVALYSMDAAFSTYESLSTWRLVLRPQSGHIVSDIDPAYAIAQTRGRGLPHPF